jgi:hypothetical protein
MRWLVAVALAAGAVARRKRIAKLLTKLTGTWVGTPPS